MFDETELLTHFHKICSNAEELALKTVHNIELPICGSLTQLTSKDCLSLIKYELDNWSIVNQPSTEKILFNYLLTDYISCGLSSPIFHTEFHKTFQTNNMKIKLLNDLLRLWDCLFKSYKITSLNVKFVEHFVASLEHVFLKIESTFTDIHIKLLSDKLVARIKSYIKSYEKRCLDTQILHTSSGNMLLHISNENSVLDTENIVPKESYESEKNQLIQHKRNTDIHKIPQKLKTKSNDAQNIQNWCNKPDLNGTAVQPPEQKLNAFQIMMLSAKKRKTQVK